MRELIEYFDRGYVINLPERTDRRKEVERELKKVGLTFSQKLRLFPAIKPTEQGAFYAMGAKGSFYSHRAVLREAMNLNNVLVFEDDVRLLHVGKQKLDAILAAIPRINWDVIYFGYIKPEQPPEGDCLVRWDGGTIGGHFYAVNGPHIKTMVDYMDACERRPRDHVDGGPTGRDGAFNHYLLTHPACRVFVANPRLALQRSSRSDITPGRLDKGPFRPLVQFARSARNLLADWRANYLMCPERSRDLTPTQVTIPNDVHVAMNQWQSCSHDAPRSPGSHPRISYHFQ